MELEGDLWYKIKRADRMKPFLMTMASDSDHWLFLLSNGGLTAGRINPDNALLPYYTQDKMADMANTSGSTTLVRMRDNEGKSHIWTPFSDSGQWDENLHRNVRKNLLGNHIVLEEINQQENLSVKVSWRPSERYGFVRKVEIQNLGETAAQLEVVDGLRNLVPPGLGQRFQNEFSILGDAYKQSELVEPENMGVYHLSSVPTDLADPMESLMATIAWQAGIENARYLLTDAQLDAFRQGEDVEKESLIRGHRGSFLTVSEMELAPGESRSWYICADINKDTRMVEAARQFLATEGNIIDAIEKDCGHTTQRMRQMLANADGLQLTAANRRSMRHTSNTLFNLMREGAFLTGYEFPVDDVMATVKHFNSEAAEDLEKTLAGTDGLTCYAPWDESHPLNKGKVDTLRILREYLPLSFSRRHGDPSRPWNRFSIEIKEEDGSPRFYYQGNWRDIFQNWEALLHSYPEYAEAAICRFLNASTADGYNPYRVTKDGFDWEVIEPSDPWANIGYWGDHQIIYLLRLLEASVKFHPGRLGKLLQEETFVYAEVPYRIRSFEDILKNPRETVDYDTEAEARIEQRIKAVGADGKLNHTRDGKLLRISLMEKLLNPLLAKLANFVPGGGIWMNTQRPEWNDANNALVGYGISVVTLGYVSRYLRFMITEFGDNLRDNSFGLSAELAELLEQQVDAFSKAPADCSPEQRLAFMTHLGQSSSAFRDRLYTEGLSGTKSPMEGSKILSFLEHALAHTDSSLKENKRPDSLWHSYNLLKIEGTGADVGHLTVMLEGQVSILSSGVLKADEVLALLRGLRQSDLYREDQQSYMLYPNKDMPLFLQKNRVNREEAVKIPLLEKLLNEGDPSIVAALSGEEVAFNGNFHNVNDLRAALGGIESDPQKQQPILELFEKTFNHHAFTGRSGTFFAYEGLGSIYWHMVSKLVLAVQENYCALKDSCPPEQAAELIAIYRELRDGLGVDKNPAVYGAFPTDAYSHTPAHAGAQQPGMTGQVKEDVLIRLRELGVELNHGMVTFNPDMIEQEEFLREATSFELLDVAGKPVNIDLEPGSLAFTFCQIPVVYHSGGERNQIRLTSQDGSVTEIEGLALDEVSSKEIFLRSAAIQRIDVSLATV
jgi:hypothetical protein